MLPENTLLRMHMERTGGIQSAGSFQVHPQSGKDQAQKISVRFARLLYLFGDYSFVLFCIHRFPPLNKGCTLPFYIAPLYSIQWGFLMPTLCSAAAGEVMQYLKTCTDMR